jgi:hypothetical protein
MESLKKQLLGTWFLENLTYIVENEPETHYFGENPTGLLIYTPENIVSAQFMDSRREAFTNEDWFNAPTEEIKCAFLTFQSYYGTYEVNEKEGAILHYIHASIFPNWHINAVTEVRYPNIDSDGKLVLTMPPILVDGKLKNFKAVWTRVMPNKKR